MQVFLKKLIIIIIIFCGLSSSITAQIYTDTSSLIIKPPIVHWYYVNIIFRKNTQTGDWMYFIRPAGMKVYEGSEMDYTYDMWESARKKRLAVGPYWDKQQAFLAQNIYQYYKKTSTNLKYPYDPNRTVYWFFIRIEVRRAGYRWKTTEAGISSGNIDEFRLSLKNGASNGLLGMGPYFQYVEVQSAFDIFDK